MESIPVIVGFVFIAFGCFMLYDTYTFGKVAKQITGKLKGYEHYISNKEFDSTKMYTPVIEFRYRGDEYCFKCTMSSSSMFYDIGESVPVLLKDNNPHNARLKTNLPYCLGGIFAFLGFVVLAVGLANFHFDQVTLTISAIILLVITYQAVQFKQKLEDKNIHSFRDLVDYKKHTAHKTEKKASRVSATESLVVDHKVKTINKHNYQPSANFIETQEQFTKQPKVPVWLSYLSVCIGLGLCIGGSYWTIQRADFLNSTDQSIGQVIDMESSTSDGSTVYYSIFEYRFPVTGENIQFRDKVGSSHPSWKIGDQITVFYDPNDKKNVLIDDGWLNWFGPGLLLVIGVVFLLIGYFMVKKQK
ncbi:MAG: hypothetical protein ACJAVV_001672 [Alphaproteobacteria bacterium]|jgi:hypothetical protein